MPIDPTGTTPGLASSAKRPAPINMRCGHQGCDSTTAVEIQAAGQESGARIYQCCKCKHTRHIAVGGGINL